LQSNDPVLAFERALEGERLLCVFNISNAPASHTVTQDWLPIGGHGFKAERTEDQLLLPPFGAAFFNR
jgi:alpha-glucosidase